MFLYQYLYMYMLMKCLKQLHAAKKMSKVSAFEQHIYIYIIIHSTGQHSAA